MLPDYIRQQLPDQSTAAWYSTRVNDTTSHDSDYQHVEWLNTIIQKIWPLLAVNLERVVPPALQSLLRSESTMNQTVVTSPDDSNSSSSSPVGIQDKLLQLLMTNISIARFFIGSIAPKV